MARPETATGDSLAEDSLVRHLGWAPTQLPSFTAYIAARTRFFDDTLLQALEGGARQVVIAAAGYDGRALRYRAPGVTFFEVDHPATQSDKRQRLHHAGNDTEGIVFVPVDFGSDNAADALSDAGLRDDARAHFLCEGLTPYLATSHLSRLVAQLGAAAPRGSTLAVDIMEKGHDQLLHRLMLVLMRSGTALMGERFVTVLSLAEASELLHDAGWSDVTITRPEGVLYPVAFALAGGR